MRDLFIFVNSFVNIYQNEHSFLTKLTFSQGGIQLLLLGGDLIQKFSCQILENYLKQASIFVVPKNVLFFRGSTFYYLVSCN